MSIPANITAELASLSAQVTAAQPLSAASRPTITALQLNAAQLVSDIQNALVAPSLLDTWSAPVDPASIVSGFNGVVTVGVDQDDLSLKRGVCGRATSNLDQLV